MEQARTIKTNRRFFMLLLMVALVATNCFFVEGNAFLDAAGRTSMSDVEFWATFSIVVVLNVGFFILAKRLYHVKGNYFFFAGALLLLASDAIVLLNFPGVYDTGELVYLPTQAERIRYLVGFGVECLSLYFAFVYIPKLFRNIGTLDWFFKALTLLAIFMIVVSYVKEYDIYIAILKNKGFVDAYTVPLSLTLNRNVYARLLLYGMVAQAYLQCVDPHWWRWLLYFFFLGNQFFILSKATLAICFVFSLLFVIYRLISTFRSHKVRNTLFIVFCLALLAFVLIGQTTGFFQNRVPGLYSLLKSAFHALTNSFGGSFDIRFYTWSDILNAQFKNPLTIVCGFGEYSLNSVLDAVVPLLSGETGTALDGTYVYVIARNGLIGALLYLVVIVYLIVLLIRSFRRGSYRAPVLLIWFFCTLLLGFFETVNLFGFKSTNMVSLFSIAAPLLCEDYHTKHLESDNTEAAIFIERPLSANKKTLSFSDWTRIFYFWLFPLCGLLYLLPGALASRIPVLASFVTTPVQISFLFAFLALPMILASLRMLRQYRCFGKYFCLLLATLLWGVALCYLPLSRFATVGPYGTIVYGLLLLTAVIFDNKMPGFSLSLGLSWPYWLAFLLLFWGYRYLGGVATIRGYLLAVCAAGVLIDWFFFAIALSNRSCLTPISDWADSVETKLSFSLTMRQLKKEVRLRKYYGK